MLLLSNSPQLFFARIGQRCRTLVVSCSDVSIEGVSLGAKQLRSVTCDAAQPSSF
jgi:hypothetical protein